MTSIPSTLPGSDIDKELRQIIADSQGDTDILMQKLASYTVRVQHTAFNEGYQKAKAKK